MPDELRLLLAKNLKTLRAYRGITQDELAEYAGLTKNYIAEIETLRKYPASKRFLDLANALDVPPWLLLYDANKVLSYLEEGSKDVSGSGELVREMAELIERYRKHGKREDRPGKS
jgi:transcriptional regulator with XRE-family HTH domain